MARALRDPLAGTYLGGARYFMDKAFHDELLRSDPATFPDGPDGFAGLWEYLRGYTMMDPWRVASIASRLWEVRHLPGDVIECGVFTGGTSIMLALLLRRWGVTKKVYMLDSFRGLPVPNATHDAFYRAGWFAVGRNTAEQLAIRCGVRGSVVIMEGWFKDTLPRLTQERFCLAHVDGDLYESTTTCLRHLVPRMVEGGVMVMDDYDDGGGGVKRAVQEHLTHTHELLHTGPLPQAYFRVGEKHRERGFRSSQKEIRGNRPYGRMVAEVQRRVTEDARAVARLHKLVNG
ncbi:MAG: class I SAM-dependent methyltransferase [Deltaproteobacteria bacterium]|nr:class I SAM-dependent methyltransferase [Deltaproteobacteria bacterium]